MKRTIPIKLEVVREYRGRLANLGNAYGDACNQIVPFAVEHRCWNRVALHKHVYSVVRKSSPLGSQMVCNAIFSVCKAYKAKQIAPGEEVPTILFRKNRSVHFDKRTYSIKGEYLSLYTLEGRITVKMQMGDFQKEYFSIGVPKEGELVYRKGSWYFHLVLDLPDEPLSHNKTLLGVDLGENNAAAISSGRIFSGVKIRHERDKFLAKRSSLQSNGSQSARQLLKKISGKEGRRMRQTNHIISKAIVQEAIKQQAGTIVLENLTNIRKRIKAGKRLRTRLHRWSFAQLQAQIQYKAEASGISVLYINPAYSSQECSLCGLIGVRKKHLFECSCGNRQHSDVNASRNHCRFALFLNSTTCVVNRTQVAANR